MFKVTLNLQRSEISDIRFKKGEFPDGQQYVKIMTENLDNHSVTIISRMNNFLDLEMIFCATAALREAKASEIRLQIPYFAGARSDRKFESGGYNYLKSVICPLINLQNYKDVSVLDPHSDILEACLDNFSKSRSSLIIKNILDELRPDGSFSDFVLVSPDAGAMKKIFDVSRDTGISKVIQASKHRDVVTGQITHTEINGISDLPPGRIFLIADDICDGGRTFTEIAKEIRIKRPVGQYADQIYLYVTHGIFSSGFKEISNWIDLVLTTNSFRDIEKSEFSEISEGFVRQIQVI